MSSQKVSVTIIFQHRFPNTAPHVLPGLLLVTLDPVCLLVYLAVFLHVCDVWYAGQKAAGHGREY